MQCGFGVFFCAKLLPITRRSADDQSATTKLRYELGRQEERSFHPDSRGQRSSVEQRVGGQQLRPTGEAYA